MLPGSPSFAETATFQMTQMYRISEGQSQIEMDGWIYRIDQGSRYFEQV